MSDKKPFYSRLIETNFDFILYTVLVMLFTVILFGWLIYNVDEADKKRYYDRFCQIMNDYKDEVPEYNLDTYSYAYDDWYYNKAYPEIIIDEKGNLIRLDLD